MYLYNVYFQLSRPGYEDLEVPHRENPLVELNIWELTQLLHGYEPKNIQLPNDVRLEIFRWEKIWREPNYGPKTTD